jgi:hypothetical protein
LFAFRIVQLLARNDNASAGIIIVEISMARAMAVMLEAEPAIAKPLGILPGGVFVSCVPFKADFCVNATEEFELIPMVGFVVAVPVELV